MCVCFEHELELLRVLTCHHFVPQKSVVGWKSWGDVQRRKTTPRTSCCESWGNRKPGISVSWTSSGNSCPRLGAPSTSCRLSPHCSLFFRCLSFRGTRVMIPFSFSNLVMLLSAGELQCRNVFGYPFKTGRITRFFLCLLGAFRALGSWFPSLSLIWTCCSVQVNFNIKMFWDYPFKTGTGNWILSNYYYYKE